MTMLTDGPPGVAIAPASRLVVEYRPHRPSDPFSASYSLLTGAHDEPLLLEEGISLLCVGARRIWLYTDHDMVSASVSGPRLENERRALVERALTELHQRVR